MQRLLVIITLAVLSAVHIVSTGRVMEEAKAVPQAEESAAPLPLPLLKITALDLDGLASDFLFLKSLVFLGSTLERMEQPRVKAWEWKWFYHTLEASTALDPYFLDPYFIANASLTWDGRLYQETNTLLEKGARYREWDSLLPFFIGFNYFYFLQENDKASEYLMEASRRPGAIPIYADLAVKIAYKGRRTENAVIFLQEILNKTEDTTLKKELEMRLEALKGVLHLENAVSRYTIKLGKTPHTLEELIRKRIIPEIPKEPYGGKYYIDAQGTVKTTSESKLMPAVRK